MGRILKREGRRMLPFALLTVVFMAVWPAQAQSQTNNFREEVQQRLERLVELLEANVEAGTISGSQMAPHIFALEQALFALDTYSPEELDELQAVLEGPLTKLDVVENFLEGLVSAPLASETTDLTVAPAAISSFCVGRPVNFQFLYAAGPPGEHACYIADFALVVVYEALPCLDPIVSCPAKAVAVGVWSANHGICRDYNRENELDTLCLLEDTQQLVNSRASQASVNAVSSNLSTHDAALSTHDADIKSALTTQGDVLEQVLANQEEIRVLLNTPQGRRPDFPEK